jgi:hypothetical protein
MTANAADFGSAALNAFARAAGLLALAIGAALAVVVGVMIAGAALAMRFWPRRNVAGASGSAVLDAHHTPEGWVVETAAKRK